MVELEDEQVDRTELEQLRCLGHVLITEAVVAEVEDQRVRTQRQLAKLGNEFEAR